jgi:hypothetical protein
VRVCHGRHLDQAAAQARVRAAAFALAACVLVLGCGRGAKTPDEAYRRFVQAVRAKDGTRLFAALDLDTRWSWMTVRRSHREAYDIILSNYPEGAEREQQLRRFETAALSDDDAALFAGQIGEARWAELSRGLVDSARVEPAGEDEARVATTEGTALVFRKAENGRWGFAGFAVEAEQRKRRAMNDLDLIRTSAADYERAATRAGR